MKPCPFCNETNCVHLTVLRSENMPDHMWNRRPIEDALRSENERIQSALTEAQEENKRMRELTVELIRLCKDIKQEAISQEPFSEPVGENLMDEWDIAIENVESALNGGK